MHCVAGFEEGTASYTKYHCCFVVKLIISRAKRGRLDYEDYERHISGKALNLARKSTCLAFNFSHLTNYIKQKNEEKNKQVNKQTTRRPTCPRSATETSCWREPPRTRLLHILVVMSILVDPDIDDDGGKGCQQKDLRHVTMLRMLPRSWLMSSKLDGSLCIALLVMLLLVVIWENILFSSVFSSLFHEDYKHKQNSDTKEKFVLEITTV